MVIVIFKLQSGYTFAESEQAMSKRQAESEPGGTEPPAKKVVFEPLQLGAINNIEELDVKTLQFQNRKLGQRLGLKNKIEEELRARHILLTDILDMISFLFIF